MEFIQLFAGGVWTGVDTVYLNPAMQHLNKVWIFFVLQH